VNLGEEHADEVLRDASCGEEKDELIVIESVFALLEQLGGDLQFQVNLMLRWVAVGLGLELTQHKNCI
jgi:hypothetical protein